MHLVEQYRRDAGQLGIGLDARDEDAFGQHGDARRRRPLAVHPRCVAEGASDRLSRGRRHPLGGGARGETAGAEQQDFAGAPRLVEQRRGDRGGLAGAGRCDEHGVEGLTQGRQQVRQDGVNRKAHRCSVA